MIDQKRVFPADLREDQQETVKKVMNELEVQIRKKIHDHYNGILHSVVQYAIIATLNKFDQQNKEIGTISIEVSKFEHIVLTEIISFDAGGKSVEFHDKNGPLKKFEPLVRRLVDVMPS